MKKQILAYIIALINAGIDNSVRLEKFENEETAVTVLETSNNGLFGLQGFVEDLNEGEVTDESIYAKRIVGLIEDCKKLRSELSSTEEYKNKIVKVGFENVTKLKAEIRQLQHDVNDYQKQREISNNAIKMFQRDNKMWQETCTILKDKNENLKDHTGYRINK
jgi:hypothetical protein